jgi:hypothetical protein
MEIQHGQRTCVLAAWDEATANKWLKDGETANEQASSRSGIRSGSVRISV